VKNSQSIENAMGKSLSYRDAPVVIDQVQSGNWYDLLIHHSFNPLRQSGTKNPGTLLAKAGI
jgi:hypothetical protein